MTSEQRLRGTPVAEPSTTCHPFHDQLTDRGADGVPLP
jgi:hypothetical protein